MKQKQPWYAEGLRFECTQCGECCSGAPGFVWVDDQEIQNISRALAIDEGQFRERFTRRIGDRMSLIEYPNGDCIFLDPDSKRCRVYAERPTQCRTWPFWDSNLNSKRAWGETCRVCPGAGVGQLHSIQTIETQRKRKSV